MKPGVPTPDLARGGIPALALSLALLVAGAAEAAELAAVRCGDAACFAAAGRSLREAGEHRGAIDVLKAGVAAHPDSATLALLLARSYLDDGNRLWALRVLAAHRAQAPDDCEVASWVAWLQLQLGALDDADLAVAEARCATPALAARRDLLRALVARHRNEPDAARDHLAAARDAEEAFAEDREAIGRLAGQEPGALPPVAARLEVAAGYTSNARAGGAADETTAGEGAGSATAQLGGWLRFVAPTGAVRPSLELEGRTLGYGADAGRDASYLLAGVRPGVQLGAEPGLLLAYRYEALRLAGGDPYVDGAFLFHEAHRVEAEAALLPALTLFGGAGRRVFRQSSRSRTEADLGIGTAVPVAEGVRLLGAITGRLHAAGRPRHDLRGGSVLLHVDLRLPAAWSARTGILFSLDHYPHSAGAFGDDGDRRRDLLGRLTAAAFTPPLLDTVRLGLSYEPARRSSTVDAYDYVDHRVLLKLGFQLAADPWLPRAAAPADHVPLDYGLAAAGLDERIQDLLRQDEAAQRSSSCVK